MTRTSKAASSKATATDAAGDPFCEHGRTSPHCEDCRAIAAGRDVDGKAPRNLAPIDGVPADQTPATIA